MAFTPGLTKCEARTSEEIDSQKVVNLLEKALKTMGGTRGNDYLPFLSCQTFAEVEDVVSCLGFKWVNQQSKDFKGWVKDVKTIQTRLGDMQDAVVFEQFIQQYQGGHARIPSSLPVPKHWNQLREPYCDLTYRRHLYGLILNPAL